MRNSGYFYVIPLLFVWSSAFPLIKVDSTYVSPAIIALVRGLVGGVTLAIISRGIYVSMKAFVAGLFNMGFFLLFLNFGVEFSSNPAEAAVMIYTQPLFVAVIEYLLGNPVSFTTGLGVSIGVIGIFISALGSGISLGILFSILGGLSWAIGTTYYRRTLSQTNVLKTNAFMSLSSTPIFALASLIYPKFIINFISISLLLAIAILSQAVGFVLWFLSLLSLGPIRASSIVLLIPMLSFVLSYLFLNSPISYYQIVGSGLILTGVFLVVSPVSSLFHRHSQGP